MNGIKKNWQQQQSFVVLPIFFDFLGKHQVALILPLWKVISLLAHRKEVLLLLQQMHQEKQARLQLRSQQEVYPVGKASSPFSISDAFSFSCAYCIDQFLEVSLITGHFICHAFM